MENKKILLKKLKEEATFISALITMIIVFMAVEIFAFAVISLNEYNKSNESSNQIIVYLNDIENSKKRSICKKILKIDGVSSLRYESKEVALKSAVLELEVEVDENENPLKDAFFVYVNKNLDIEKAKEQLKKMDEVYEVDFRTKALETSFNFSNGLEKITLQISMLFIIVGLIMIYNIISFNVKSRKKEINELLYSGFKPLQLKKVFFYENIKLILIASILSFLFYNILIKFLEKNIRLIISNFAFKIFIGSEFLIVIILLIISILISAIITFVILDKHFRIEGLVEETKEEIKEETKEELEEIEEIEYEEDIDE